MKTSIIQLNEGNISDEHICCGFSDKKCSGGYENKKEWLKNEFKNDYTFKKLNVRGKVFIEYCPIEDSWLPLEGKKYMVINCFWVSGQFKGQGYGKQLLKECIEDAEKKKMNGIIAVSSDKKRPFMSDPKFLKMQGFRIIDEAPPFFKLWGLTFNENAETPGIMQTAKKGISPDKKGISVYYSETCPFNDYYINDSLKKYALKKDVPLKIHKIKSKEDGHKLPIPWIICSIFYNGELVTLEMKPDKYLDKLIIQ